MVVTPFLQLQLSRGAAADAAVTKPFAALFAMNGMAAVVGHHVLPNFHDVYAYVGLTACKNSSQMQQTHLCCPEAYFFEQRPAGNCCCGPGLVCLRLYSICWLPSSMMGDKLTVAAPPPPQAPAALTHPS
jgi:hypothetical protein